MSLALRTGLSTPRRGRSPAGVWRALRGALKHMERRARLRREIERMDDRMLSDIGVSRAQVNYDFEHGR